MDKTIRKLTLTNGSILTTQNEILQCVRDYYVNLFSNKNDYQYQLLNDLGSHCTIEPLDRKNANMLEGYITVKELSEALSKMKNNKTPGLDGFPADFFKVFWLQLINFVMRTLNESFIKKCLPHTLRQVVINCIPKGNKPRDSLKNWRPIFLANVLYKLGSSVIATRIKSVIDIRHADRISPR